MIHSILQSINPGTERQSEPIASGQTNIDLDLFQMEMDTEFKEQTEVSEVVETAIDLGSEVPTDDDKVSIGSPFLSTKSTEFQSNNQLGRTDKVESDPAIDIQLPDQFTNQQRPNSKVEIADAISLTTDQTGQHSKISPIEKIDFWVTAQSIVTPNHASNGEEPSLEGKNYLAFQSMIEPHHPPVGSAMIQHRQAEVGSAKIDLEDVDPFKNSEIESASPIQLPNRNITQIVMPIEAQSIQVTPPQEAPTTRPERILNVSSPDHHWVSDLGQEITRFQKNDGVLSLQLRPAFLGDLRIEIDQQKADGTIKMVVENEAAKSFLIAAQPRLEQDIRLNGMKSAQIEVAVQTGPSPGSDFQGSGSNDHSRRNSTSLQYPQIETPLPGLAGSHGVQNSRYA